MASYLKKEELVAGARVEVSKSKKDPLDFVLWKPSLRTEDPGWDPRGEKEDLVGT